MEIEYEKLSPMMKLYLETKEEYKDCVLFYRLGDFYEMFFEDAINVSRELELTLTGKDCGQEERAPMCGVPFHAAETYINRLVEKGYKLLSADVEMIPATYTTLTDEDAIRKMNLLLENLEDNDDVQNVYHNWDE